jgi:hypothetical protein
MCICGMRGVVVRGRLAPGDRIRTEGMLIRQRVVPDPEPAVAGVRERTELCVSAKSRLAHLTNGR